jgi:1,4-dihydroxy-6-naphthoate synthase
MQRQVDQLIQTSLRKAAEGLPELSDYVQLHAQEMDASVQRKHIDLYVNEFSREVGVEGKNAVQVLMQVHQRLNGGSLPILPDIFIG